MDSYSYELTSEVEVRGLLGSRSRLQGLRSRSRSPGSRSRSRRVDVEVQPVTFFHPYQVRGERPPGRRCGANGPRGEKEHKTCVRCHAGSAFFHAQPRAALAAVLPRGMPPRMRCATFNVDLQRQYFESHKQQPNPDIAEPSEQVDVLALQELGTWDKPLEEEP